MENHVRADSLVPSPEIITGEDHVSAEGPPGVSVSVTYSATEETAHSEDHTRHQEPPAGKGHTFVRGSSEFQSHAVSESQSARTFVRRPEFQSHASSQSQGYTQSQASMQQASSQKWAMDAEERFLILWSIFLTITFVSGVAALYLAFPSSFLHVPTDISHQKPFCCSDVIDTLTSMSNRNVDPCADFLNYACYKKSGQSQTASALQSLQSMVIHPTLQGRIRNPVTDRLRAHYTSCLAEFVENLCTPERTARAMVAMYRSWSHDPLRVNLLGLVGRLDFIFRIRSVFRVLFQRLLEPSSQDYVRNLLIEPMDVGFVLNSDDSTDIEHLMFSAIREDVGGQVAVEDVTGFNARLRAAHVDFNVDYEDFDNHVHVENRTQLDQLLSRTNLSAWNEVLEYHERFIAPFKYVLRSPQAAQNLLEVISDDDPQVQASGLAYFAIHTASSVFYDDIQFTYRGGSITTKAAYCDGKIIRLAALWDMAATTEMTSSERDAVVRSMFDAIVAAIGAEIDAFFSDKAGLGDLLVFLKYIYLVLPQDLYDVYFQFLPALGQDYIENVMELRKFEFFFDSSNAVRGLGNLWSYRGSVLDGLVLRYRNIISVSPNIYPLLGFAESGRNITNGAVLGVWLADKVWEALLDASYPRDWNPDAEKLIDLLQLCGDTYLFSDELSYDALSVRATLRVLASTPGWHTKALAFDFWMLSPSQVFFMLLVVQHSCESSSAYHSNYLEEARIFRRFKDFRQAFGCTHLLVDDPECDWITA